MASVVRAIVALGGHWERGTGGAQEGRVAGPVPLLVEGQRAPPLSRGQYHGGGRIGESCRVGGMEGSIFLLAGGEVPGRSRSGGGC